MAENLTSMEASNLDPLVTNAVIISLKQNFITVDALGVSMSININQGIYCYEIEF